MTPVVKIAHVMASPMTPGSMSSGRPSRAKWLGRRICAPDRVENADFDRAMDGSGRRRSRAVRRNCAGAQGVCPSGTVRPVS